jgi:hypothetical protein
MFRLTLTGFLRVLRFFPVALNPSYIHLLYHNDKSAKPDRTFKRSGALSDVGNHWAEKCFHSVFCIVVCCSRVIARPSHVSNWIFSLKLNVFMRIIWTTRDGGQRITDLPLIELTTENFYRYLGANHWSFYNVIPLPQNGLQREIKESVCAEF